MIQEKINNDIEQEFADLRIFYEKLLQDNVDIESQKEFVVNNITSDILNRSELLLDTLLNYLMEAAIKELEKFDMEIQNDFFNQGFRIKIRELINLKKNQIQHFPLPIEFSTDPRWQQSAIAGGATFIVGASVTLFVFDPTKIIGVIVAGLTTIILSAYAFRKGFKHAETKARIIIKNDVNSYINKAELQVTEWLRNVIDIFAEELKSFAASSSIKIDTTTI